MERAYLAEDVRSVEKPLLNRGQSVMSQAAYEVAQCVIHNLRERGLRVAGSTVLAVVGRGNNGGDALFAAAILARHGMAVVAAIYQSAHGEGLIQARRAGVHIIDLAQVGDACATLRDLAFDAGTWIDGILGIGTSGNMRDPWKTWIALLNEERAISPAEPFVVAVDVPSGVSIDTGEVDDVVLRADVTVAMGCAKPCHLLPPARYYCGKVKVLELGFVPYLPKPAVVELGNEDVNDLWNIPSIDDHKYTRGVVGLYTGSDRYPGAGVLSVGGARAVGPGMVRYLGQSPAVLPAYPDVVRVDGRVQAWVIGSGEADLGRCVRLLERGLDDGVPVVLDAGAITLINDVDVPATVVVTPHEGELAALLTARGEPISREDVHAHPARAARIAATITGATVLLKGAVDIAVGPDGPLYAQGGAPSWRGTAGAGDVLAGMVGGMLAGYGDELHDRDAARSIPACLAAAAAHIHAQAARLAAGPGYGAPITALDILHHVHHSIYAILNPDHHHNTGSKS